MKIIFTIALVFLVCFNSISQIDSTLKIFQFPADKIPRIDGDPSDWDMVPSDYIIGNDQLRDDTKKHPVLDTMNINVKVKVGWVRE